jgi:predicted phosphodiesterase
VLGILYDLHGNLPALEAVLEEAREAGVERWLLGGDYGAHSPWPLEVLERLRGLENATWIRGNGERWTRETPLDRPEVMEMLLATPTGWGTEEGWLYSLQVQVELDGILFVHGSPLSDVESFAAEPQPGEERLLAGVRGRTIVFGHSHLQFRRPGPDATDLVNPGSAGMPLDGDVRATWTTWDGDFVFRRTAYDVERAAQAWERMQNAFGSYAAGRIRRGSD